jgi:hypothetical protein
MTKFRVGHHVEPELQFGYGQCLDDPKQGLFLFGPLEERRPSSMRVGVVGTPAGIELYKQWVRAITGFIPAARPDALHQIGFPVLKRHSERLGRSSLQPKFQSRPVTSQNHSDF